MKKTVFLIIMKLQKPNKDFSKEKNLCFFLGDVKWGKSKENSDGYGKEEVGDGGRRWNWGIQCGEPIMHNNIKGLKAHHSQPFLFLSLLSLSSQIFSRRFNDGEKENAWNQTSAVFLPFFRLEYIRKNIYIRVFFSFFFFLFYRWRVRILDFLWTCHFF